jgi:hypothetical protein
MSGGAFTSRSVPLMVSFMVGLARSGLSWRLTFNMGWNRRIGKDPERRCVSRLRHAMEG